MRKATSAICMLLTISSFAVAQTYSSTSTSSSSFSCPCHTTQTSAENSISQLHKECKEKNGEDSFSMKKMSENCFCIEGACDIHYSSASIDTVNYNSSSSSIVVSSSSEYIYTGGVCYIDSVYYEGVKNVPTVHRGLYSVLPYMKNADNIKVSKCSCNQDGSFKCNYSNFGVPIGYKPIDVPLCGLRDAYWCPGINNGMCDYSGSSIEIYYSDQYWKTDYTWGVKNFSNNGVFEINDGSQPLYVVTTDNERYLFFWMNRPLPQNITTYDLEDAFLKANPRFPSIGKMNEYCRGEWFPHDEDCFGYASEVEIALQDSIDHCVLSMGISKYDTTLSDRGWCVVGTCEPGEDPYYSSSSSFVEESSSSDAMLCKSVPIDEIPYNPKSSCFENNGRCYKCKAGIDESDCRSSWTWQNPYTPVDTYYWFNEVDCSTGEKMDKGIGACPAQPLDDIPNDLSKACFALSGKCYKCKDTSPNGGCAESWIWTQKLYYIEPHYLEEVDCYDPFEEDDENLKCYEVVLSDEENDEFFLLKQQLKENESYEELLTINGEVNKINNYYYDALGRSIQKNKMKKNKSYFMDLKVLDSDQNLVTRVLKKDKTYSGYVNGTIHIDWCETKTEKDGEYKINHIKVSMNVISGSIHVESNDERLIAHEKGHKEIWDDEKYKSTKTLTVSIPKGKTKKEICELEAERSWAYVRDDLYDIYTRHNNWDDSDANNISHARINIPEQMRKHEEKFLNKCK